MILASKLRSVSPALPGAVNYVGTFSQTDTVLTVGPDDPYRFGVAMANQFSGGFLAEYSLLPLVNQVEDGAWLARRSSYYNDDGHRVGIALINLPEGETVTMTAREGGGGWAFFVVTGVIDPISSILAGQTGSSVGPLLNVGTTRGFALQISMGHWGSVTGFNNGMLNAVQLGYGMNGIQDGLYATAVQYTASSSRPVPTTAAIAAAYDI